MSRVWTKLGIDGAVGLDPDGFGPVEAEIGLVSGPGTALSVEGGADQTTAHSIDGSIAANPENFERDIQVVSTVIETGAALAVTDPNDVVVSIGLVTGSYAAFDVTELVSATITSVSSNRGTNIIAASETLTVNVDNSNGITSVTVNGVATTLVQIITGTEVTCVVPLGVAAPPGTSVDVVVNNGVDSSPFSALFEPPTGFIYTSFTVDYAGLDPDSPFAGDTDFSDLAVGDVCVYSEFTTPDSNSVSMAGNGEFTIGGTVTQLQTYDYYIYDASDQTNSSTIEQIEVYPGPVEAEIGLVTGTGTAFAVTADVAVTGQIGAVTGLGQPQAVADGSIPDGEIGLVTGVGTAPAVTGGVSQVISINQVVGSAGAALPVSDASIPSAEIGMVTGLGVPISVIDATAVVQAISQVTGAGAAQSVSFPADLDDIQTQLANLQASVDTLQVSVDSITAVLAAQQVLIEELHTRFDLDATNPNTYADDASSIANTDFTLTKTDNGNGTFDITRS